VLAIGDLSILGTVAGSPRTSEGLTCVQIDEKRWLLSGAVPEAGGAYAALKRGLKVRGSIEGYLECADDDDPHLAPLIGVERRFREIYTLLLKSRAEGDVPPALALPQVKSPAWARRLADALGATLTVCTESEPACRGAALWALERIGAIEDPRALPASMGAVFTPLSLETIK
jgi:hypothetical protein